MPTAQGLTVGSVFMSAEDQPTALDSFGVKWGLTKLDGWWDGYAAPDSGVTNRVSDHGGLITDVYAAPRVV